MLSSSIEVEICELAREMQPERWELFLEEVVNLRQTDAAAISRFLKKHAEFILPQKTESGKARLASGSPAVELGFAQVNDSLPRAMFSIQFLLRSAWRRSTTFEREVSLELTKWTVQEGLNKAFTNQEPIWRVSGNIYIALMAATRLADRFRYCANPNCPAPYFIAKRRSEKYCSKDCANVAQREQKRSWWDENRKGKKRKDKQPRRKRRKSKRHQ